MLSPCEETSLLEWSMAWRKSCRRVSGQRVIGAASALGLALSFILKVSVILLCVFRFLSDLPWKLDSVVVKSGAALFLKVQLETTTGSYRRHGTGDFCSHVMSPLCACFLWSTAWRPQFLGKLSLVLDNALCPHWEYLLCHVKDFPLRLWAECNWESAMWPSTEFSVIIVAVL